LLLTLLKLVLDAAETKQTLLFLLFSSHAYHGKVLKRKAFQKKERRVYGRFLMAAKSTAPTIAMAIMIATPMPMMYMSLFGTVISGYGDAVGAAGSTAKLASECEGQYDSLPANVARTVYLPSMSGFHCRLK
jgi:hypothetical protein